MLLKFLLTTVVALCCQFTLATQPINVDVAVIGAGLAGAEIATLAKKDGRIPTIFESRSSFGGRTHRIEVGGYYFPKGAGWQAGLGPLNPISKRLRVCNISNVRVNWNRWRDYCKTGQECEESWDEFETAFACASELATEMKILGLAPVSQDTGFKLCGWKPQTDAQFLYQSSTVNYEWAETSYVNSLMGSLPLLSHIVYQDADKFITDPRSSQELVGCWLDRFGIGRQNSPQVNYNSGVVNINTATQIITLANGSTYHYNVVFNTMPNGVLSWNQVREDGSLFTPKLSFNRVLALQGYHTPVYLKIFLQFPTAFWNSFKPNIQYFNIWANALHECTIWQNVDLPDFWPGSKIMYLTCTSPQSDMGENLNNNEWKQLLMPQLRNVFGNDIPDPTLIKVARWLDDPNFRGTYSNAPVEFTLEKFNEFYQPLGTNGTHIFAGEAYCYNLFGYMQSAILSGSTAWCEYQVRNGVYPPTRECRKIAVDADGKEYPNYCWDEALTLANLQTTQSLQSRSINKQRVFRRRNKIAQHNLNVSDAEFQEKTARKFNRALAIVTGA